jgi:predicted acetyltransferase
MSAEIRLVPEDRFAEYIRTAEIAFSENMDDDLIGRLEVVADKSRFLCAIDNDQFVGTSGVFTQRLSVPGGEVAAGGVTFVTIVPSHRRRGLMSGMMRAMIDDCHRRGEPIAMLWAAEGAIYQRFGYGQATDSVNLAAETQAIRFTRDWKREGQIRLLPAGEGRELIDPVYQAARGARAGFLMRDEKWWPGVLPNKEKDKKGGEVKRLAVFEVDGSVEAYAVYKTKSEWSERGPSFPLTVEEAVGCTPRGTREIWRFLFEVDLVRTLKTWRLPTDHPIFSLVAEPRRLGTNVGDGLWVRIVEVVSALAARTYGIDGHGDGRLVFEMADEYCPWNAGRWSLEVSDGRAQITRTNADPDLGLDANDLASMYLGGVTATGLAGAGRVVELRPGGLAAADRLFPTALQPWCPQEF